MTKRFMPGLLLLWFFCAYFIGRAGILGSFFPFASAFAAAASAYYGKISLIFLPSLLLGLYHVLDGGLFFAYAACALTLCLIFLFYPANSKKQFYIVPVMVVAMTAVGKGLAVSLMGGTSYDLMISGFESILSAALSVVFLVMFRASSAVSLSRRFAADETACCFVMLIGVLGGMSDLYIGNISVQSLFSCFTVLTAAYLGGAGCGSAAGALIGIIPSLSQVVEPVLITAYAFAGLLTGVFNNFGHVGSVMGFLFGNLLMAFYIGEGARIAAWLAAGTVASIIFFMLPNKLYSRLSMAFNIRPLKTAAESRSEKCLSFRQAS